MGYTEFPIYVTVPPYLLNDFLSNLNPSFQQRAEDFVFFSGGNEYGNIEELLQAKGYCRDSMTQVLVSGMRVKPSTGRPVDLHVNLGVDEYGEPKLAGECSACGKWNGAVAERFGDEIRRFCRTDFYREWRRKMWERSLYDAVFNLLGSVRQEPTSIKDVATYYEAEVSDMAWDLSQLIRGWKAVSLMYGFEERIFAVAEKSGNGIDGDGSEPTMCVLQPWMYPYIYGNNIYVQSKRYVEYLQYAQMEFGLLEGVQLPTLAGGDDAFGTKMRKGNLRADGVV